MAFTRTAVLFAMLAAAAAQVRKRVTMDRAKWEKEQFERN